MNRLALLTLCVFSTASGAMLEATARDKARLLAAIEQVEDWRGHDGAAGERGPWQITPAVWRQHCPAWSFETARQRGRARICAERHLAWLSDGLLRKGIAPVPFMLALAWNAGLTGATNGRAPVRAYEYAVRVENIYQASLNSPTK